MRFQKGSIELSAVQDLPLLRQVLRSQYATHNQLFEHMQLGCHEMRRQSFNWRIKRLVDHQLMLRHYIPTVASSYVYSIGMEGFLYLQGIGECCEGVVTLQSKSPVHLNCFHSIELNELQLALERQNLLDQWIPEIEIRSRNEMTNARYAKDYDAIVTLRLGAARPQFALEYERSPKSFRQYDSIRRAIDAETSVGEFLYLTVSDRLQAFLSHCFAQTKRRLYVGRARDFLASALTTPVVEVATGRQVKFGDCL
jgi:hypothetical protein